VPLLELKDFGVVHGATRVAGIDLGIEPASMLAVVGRGDGAASLVALAIAGLLPRGAATEGTLTFAGKRLVYLDRHADASAVSADADLIVADEPGRGRDPATQLELLKALQSASRTAAVIIFTADFRLALSMGLEVAVIAGGKLLLKAPASQIFELPQYDTVRHLVGGERLRTRTLMRPPIGEPVLEVDGVGKSYSRGLPRLGPPPKQVLEGIGFAVRQGEVVGMLGPSGAGKTTLLRLVAGLERPSAGHIGRRPGMVGYVFPDPRRAFNPTLAVGVSLTEPLRVEQTLLVEEQADRLVDAVRAVGLEPELLAHPPGAFGAAELQRMALARALVGRPALVLLDDPTACLDPAEAREFLLYLARVRADFGLTAIIASREFEVLKAVADRLLVLEAGHIVEGGKPAELGEAPKQEITRRLVSVRYPVPMKPEPVAAERTAPPAPEEPAPEVVAEPADAPVEAPPELQPVHGLSATVVIAPVVLTEAASVPAAEGEVAPVAPAEPVREFQPVAEPLPEPPAADPGPAPAEPSPEPVEAPAEVVAEPPPAPAPSVEGADKAAETGENEAAIDRPVDASGGADAPDDEPAR
jgi:ABC-type glutathione transport system ATPase component